ncbi:hypothetical protein [Mesobacillus boroniphilus]|nr:hypothetical protein [Mesobacillus boroniphilus]
MKKCPSLRTLRTQIGEELEKMSVIKAMTDKYRWENGKSVRRQ